MRIILIPLGRIDRLQAYGINAADIMKLKNGGYCTVLSIIQATKKELCQIKGISEAKVEKVLEAAAKIEVVSEILINLFTIFNLSSLGQ